MYPPPCGRTEKAHTQLRPWGVPIPQAAQAGIEELGCICRFVGGEGGNEHTRLPHGAPSSKRPRQDQRDSGVFAVV